MTTKNDCQEQRPRIRRGHVIAIVVIGVIAAISIVVGGAVEREQAARESMHRAKQRWHECRDQAYRLSNDHDVRAMHRWCNADYDIDVEEFQNR